MEEKVTEKVNKMRIPYIAMRLLTIVFVLLLFFPDLNPANIIQKAGQAKISGTSSLFTSSVSYSSLT